MTDLEQTRINTMKHTQLKELVCDGFIDCRFFGRTVFSAEAIAYAKSKVEKNIKADKARLPMVRTRKVTWYGKDVVRDGRTI